MLIKRGGGSDLLLHDMLHRGLPDILREYITNMSNFVQIA